MIEFGVMRRVNPLKAGLIALPLIYGVTIFINVWGVANKGPECKLIFNFFFSSQNIKEIFNLFSVIS